MNIAALAESNAQRAALSAGRNTDLARRALTLLGDRCPPSYRAIAEARIAHPSASWQELGAKLHLTKAQASTRFHRMIDTIRDELERTGAALEPKPEAPVDLAMLLAAVRHAAARPWVTRNSLSRSLHIGRPRADLLMTVLAEHRVVEPRDRRARCRSITGREDLDATLARIRAVSRGMREASND